MRRKVRKKGRIGIVINTAVKPSRDILLGVMDSIHSANCGKPLLFHAGSATSPANLKAFVEAGLDGMIFCGVRLDILMKFARIVPVRPPVVICTYVPLTEEERYVLGHGGEVVLDNESIGAQAADFFIGHGLRNFAFLGANVFRERVAGEIRCDAFRRRLEERLGTNVTFSKCVVGVVADNEDFWELGNGDTEKWITSLPHSCGVLVNGDREAVNLLSICRRYGIKVPDDLEVLGINNSHGFCEQARPAISSLCPDLARCAKEAVDMLSALIANPDLPAKRRKVMVGTCKLVERGSTSNGEYGHVVARAREYIIKNACGGIDVSDVVRTVKVSRRLLEKRVREATGQSVLDMIQKVRLESVCRLLSTTSLPIADVTTRSGYELTSNLGRLFRRTFGMSMREYRLQHGSKT